MNSSRLFCLSILAALPAMAALAQSSEIQIASAEDDIVRLPGQGELKPEAAKKIIGAERLISGGGLILSFDADADGKITMAELESGVAIAFETADRNDDGRITPLEQMAWADGLPTRDTSLANPARFDPNLDRVVREAEFTEVVISFASGLADETTGDIHLERLKSNFTGRRAIEEPVAPPRRESEAERISGSTGTAERNPRGAGRGS